MDSGVWPFCGEVGRGEFDPLGVRVLDLAFEVSHRCLFLRPQCTRNTDSLANRCNHVGIGAVLKKVIHDDNVTLLGGLVKWGVAGLVEREGEGERDKGRVRGGEMEWRREEEIKKYTLVVALTSAPCSNRKRIILICPKWQAVCRGE